MDKLSTEKASSEHLCESSSSATIMGRRQRAQKRHRSDDSASQTSLSSPPSSPIFVPKRVKSSRFLDDELTETESDMDDGHVRIRERTASDYSKRDERPEKNDSKGTSPASSDTEQSRALRKRKYEGLRDPYKLRSVPTQSRLPPVEEDTQVSKTSLTSDSAFLAPSTDVGKVHFTTPSRGSSAVKFTQPEIPKSEPSAHSGPQDTSFVSSEASLAVGKNIGMGLQHNSISGEETPLRGDIISLYCEEEASLLFPRRRLPMEALQEDMACPSPERELAIPVATTDTFEGVQELESDTVNPSANLLQLLHLPLNAGTQTVTQTSPSVTPQVVALPSVGSTTFRTH